MRVLLLHSYSAAKQKSTWHWTRPSTSQLHTETPPISAWRYFTPTQSLLAQPDLNPCVCRQGRACTGSGLHCCRLPLPRYLPRRSPVLGRRPKANCGSQSLARRWEVRSGGRGRGGGTTDETLNSIMDGLSRHSASERKYIEPS